MEEILLKLRRLTQQVKDSSAQTITDLKPTIDGIKTNFDEWKVPWTQDRAEKLDKLDVAISTRASEVTARNIEDNTGMTLEKVRQLFPAGASKTFTTPGTHTFTVPEHVGIITVFCVGAGGGGGGGGSRNSSKEGMRSGGGGGGGGKREATISVTPGSNLTVVVGAGGAGGKAGSSTTEAATSGGKGGTGGSSSVGEIIATGGGGGGGGFLLSQVSAGGAGGVLDGFPGTNAGRYDQLGQGGASPSAYGSYGRGGAGGRAGYTTYPIGLDGEAGLDGFVMISY